METKKLTIKDSALSFLIGFLLCQLSVVVASCFCLIFFKLVNYDMENYSVFFSTAIGYMILSLTLYTAMLLVFIFFKRKKEDKITKPINVKKLLLYILISAASFFALYPIIVCVDSLLSKCGVKLSTLSYDLTTKNYFISLISLVIAPAVCEELLFRGIIFSGLKKHGKIFSITITALMFIIFHMSISQTVYPLLMGLLLSVIMFYEQNIYYCIAVHITNNFLSLTLSYFKINLVFSHWSYIVLAIILAIAFICTILFFIIKNHKSYEKQKLTKTELIYLLVSLSIMILFWILTNLQ